MVYYITKYRNLIQIGFSKEFILGAAELVLKINNFILLGNIFNQVTGIALGTTKFTPPYANLSVWILEETILLPVELPKYFSHDNCKLIDKYSKDIWITVLTRRFQH